MIPQAIIDSYRTANSRADGTLVQPDTPQNVAAWAVQQGFMTQAQANTALGQTSTTTPTTTSTFTGTTGGTTLPIGSGTSTPPIILSDPTPTTNTGFGGLVGNSTTGGVAGGTGGTGSTGFGGLTGGAITPVSTTPTSLTPPPITTGTGTSGVQPTYTQLLAQYQQEHPGQPAPTGDALNAWASSKGITSWTDDGGVNGGTNVYNPAPVGNQNYAQNQNALQTGQFSTIGQNNMAQNQTTGQNTNTTNNTNQTTTGTTTGTTNQTQGQTGGSTESVNQTGTTQGTTTTGVNDTLGFGALLQGAAGGAQSADAARNAYLTDMVNTGGSAFNSQVDQAVRNSLTGPQMTGAGDSARARAAGYAGAQIARQNTDQRLNAAGQLTGPTALTSLAGAANPYLGQTQTTSGTNTNTGTTTGTSFANLVNAVNSSQNTSQNQNTSGTGSSASTGFNNLTGSSSESQAGSAAGQSSQNAAGQIPQAQTVNTGGGGCIICTVGIEHGVWKHHRILRKVVKHKLQKAWTRFRNAARGYFFLFTPLAVLALRYPLLARLLMKPARAIVYEELRVAGVRLPLLPVPWVLHWTWHAACSGLGRLPWARDVVTDPRILRVGEKHKVFFKVGGK